MDEAISQTNNVWTDKYFAISMGSIMIMFGFSHWGNVAFRKYGPKEPGKLLGGTIRAYRLVLTILGMSGSDSMQVCTARAGYSCSGKIPGQMATLSHVLGH